MEHNTKIAVIGGGRSGKYLIRQLLSEGYSLRILLRNPENFSIESPHIEIVRGDAINAEDIRLLTESCRAVISTLGQRKGEPLVTTRSTENILHAMNENNVQRFIAVAGLTIDTPFDKKRFSTRMVSKLIKWIFPAVVADKQNAYHILSRSTVNWTLVRTPRLESSDVRSQFKVSLEDCPGSKLTRADLAVFLSKQLLDNTYSQKAPFVASA